MYPARAATPTAADGLNYLLSVVVEGTQEDPTLKAVEAAPALLLVLFVLIYTDGALPLR
jgi:hypothetical protein